MSDTPRTDEQAQQDAAEYHGHSRDYVSLITFARQLERENNELRRNKERIDTVACEFALKLAKQWKEKYEVLNTNDR